ncbi:hypothetical protein HYX18_01615 [Candidatus Woesearchaeota archaeon]|nr:hypothetical protein [Candidatus Woesearchaeota archaeon]
MADIKQIAIIVGIAVIFTALVIVSMEAFYETPKYDVYCNYTISGPYRPYEKPYLAEIVNESCNYVYETQEVKNCYNEKGQPLFNYTKDKCPIFAKCDYCQKYLEDATKKHSNLSFIIIALIGIVAIVFGVLFKIEFIGSGFMYGGIATLFYATMRFLMEQNKYIRVIILFLELLIVLWIGYKKLYKKKDEHL